MKPPKEGYKTKCLVSALAKVLFVRKKTVIFSAHSTPKAPHNANAA